MTRPAGQQPDGAATPPPLWLTGTVEDQFTPIYMVLGRDTMRSEHGPWHRGFAPHAVDLMDLTTVAAFMGVGEEEARQRAAWDRMRAPGPEVVMERKVRTEAPVAGGAILPG